MFCQIAGQDAVRIRAECPPARAPGLRALTHGLNGRAELCVTLEISSDCQEVSPLVASRRGATLCHRGHQQEEGHVQGAGGREGHVHGATHVSNTTRFNKETSYFLPRRSPAADWLHHGIVNPWSTGGSAGDHEVNTGPRACPLGACRVSSCGRLGHWPLVAAPETSPRN